VIRALATRAALAVTGLLLLAPGAFAVEDQDIAGLTTGGEPTTTTVPTSGVGDLGRVLLGLFLVVLVIGALYAGLKRTQRGRLPGTTSNGVVQVRETTQLGPGRNLHLVEIGDRVLLVGATEHGINLLQGYDREEAAAEGLLGDDEAVAAVLPAARPPAPVTAQSRTFMDALRERTTR
jgi:flagellar biosynthetic protein FliO